MRYQDVRCVRSPGIVIRPFRPSIHFDPPCFPAGARRSQLALELMRIMREELDTGVEPATARSKGRPGA